MLLASVLLMLFHAGEACSNCDPRKETCNNNNQ